MIGRLSHVGIAVPDLHAARQTYENLLGAGVSEAADLPEHGITTVVVELPNARIELMQPLGPDSPISRFLKKHPAGGIHHLCFEVEDLDAARDRLLKEGARLLGPPRPGAHGRRVQFIHPKDCSGTLIELEEASKP